MTAELIGEFADWLNERDAPDTAAFASHAEMFLDWRESAPLAPLDDGDLREYRPSRGYLAGRALSCHRPLLVRHLSVHR